MSYEDRSVSRRQIASDDRFGSRRVERASVGRRRQWAGRPIWQA